jgi:hypothetical protein
MCALGSIGYILRIRRARVARTSKLLDGMAIAITIGGAIRGRCQEVRNGLSIQKNFESDRL